jgi:hypothetical protein
MGAQMSKIGIVIKVNAGHLKGGEGGGASSAQSSLRITYSVGSGPESRDDKNDIRDGRAHEMKSMAQTLVLG